MDRRGMLRCLLAAVLFGATAPIASELAGSIPAFTLAGLLYVGAGLAVLPAVARRPPTRRALVTDGRAVTAAVVAGGAVGPVLLVLGLARTSAATGSILLNAELAATALLAALFFREHLGARVIAGVVSITVAGAVLTWEPGAAVDVGALLIVAACVCWALDNCVTAVIDQLAPEHVVLLKGTVAGGANLAIGLTARGWGVSTSAFEVGFALLVGAAGYGWSITLWVRGARDLGAARAQVVFATAPFIGVAVAWVALGEAVRVAQLVAVGFAAAGVAVSQRSDHHHDHHHDPIEHEHEHTHDDEHHHHPHDQADDGDAPGRRPSGGAVRHSHRHRHEVVVHEHPHAPDLHHRHDH